MTATPPPAPRIISFGDLDGRLWGCLLAAGEPLLVVAVPEGTTSGAGADAVSLQSEGEAWRVTGPGVELLVAPADDGDRRPAAPAPELCTVSGSITVAGSDHQVQALATASVGEPLNAGRLDSLRALSSWFEADDGLALLSLRPSGRHDQESDIMAATLFDPEGAILVDDPRLSTTYRQPEQPDRASVELWIGEGEEQYPRRAAAEAEGEAITVRNDHVRLSVTPMRCHKAGRDGAGVYVLARFTR
jgi:hypothetical protein